MIKDLFESKLTRDQLAAIYLDTASTMGLNSPTRDDLSKMGRAALVDLIEQLGVEAAVRRRDSMRAART